MKASLAVLFAVALVVVGEMFGYLRTGVGLTVVALVLVAGFKYWRDVGLIPPEPEATDVRAQGLRYVCAMCGLQLKVEVAAKERPPKHCGESMQLIGEGEPAPPRLL